MTTTRRNLHRLVSAEDAQTVKAYAVGLLWGAGVGLACWALWRAFPCLFVLAMAPFMMASENDPGTGRPGGD
jgi:hypothetical protein